MLWMDRHHPNLDANQAPFPSRGRVGDTVRGRDFALVVERVALARRLELAPGYGKTSPERRDTGGIWLLILARLDGLHAPVTLGAAHLRAVDGTEYASAGDRLPYGYGLLASETAAPDMPARGLLVFELPPGRLAGAVLVASREPIPALDSTVEIDLGLRRDDAAQRLRQLPPAFFLEKR
ncbi:MAG: hypothetical protein ACRD2X_25110 [Vicinamibacteraceae bacterium]